MSAEVCPSEASADGRRRGRGRRRGTNARGSRRPGPGGWGRCSRRWRPATGAGLRLPAARTSDTFRRGPGAGCGAMAGRAPGVGAGHAAGADHRCWRRAASAVVAVCLDPREGPPAASGHDAVASWVGGPDPQGQPAGARWPQLGRRCRSCRGSRWRLPSGAGVAEVRALVPGLVAEAPKEVSPAADRRYRPCRWTKPGSPGGGAAGDLAEPGGRADRRQGGRPGGSRLDDPGRHAVGPADLAPGTRRGCAARSRVASERRWREVLDAAAGPGRPGPFPPVLVARRRLHPRSPRARSPAPPSGWPS